MDQIEIEDLGLGLEIIDKNMVEKFIEELPEKAFRLSIQVVLAFVFIIIGIQLIKIIRKIVKKSLIKSNADQGVIQFLDSFIKAALYILLFFLVASSFGLEATSVVAVIGSAGVAIGLALQGSLSNFAGGVLILLLKPFRIGDYIIEDTNKNEGIVTEIELFYTKLTTPDNKVIVLPNGALANTSLTNTTQSPNRRIDILVGVSYATNIKLAKEVLTKMVGEFENTLKDCEYFVYVDSLGDHSVILGVRCYVLTENYWKSKWDLTEKIKETLDEHQISIPFPQLDVLVKS
ncbi:MAG: mechanosensitive ion channel family protein [Lachnospiraceae bacterium]